MYGSTTNRKISFRVLVDAVSHHEVLAGRHAQSITVGANRSVTKHGQLGEAEFYDILKEKYLLSYEQMRENSYPLWDPFDEGVVTVNTSQRDRNKQPYVEDNGTIEWRLSCSNTDHRSRPEARMLPLRH